MKWIAEAKAWLDGEKIQVLSADGIWINVPSHKEVAYMAPFSDNYEYRIAPKKKTYYVRLAHMTTHIEAVTVEEARGSLLRAPLRAEGFKEWVGSVYKVEFEESLTKNRQEPVRTSNSL